MSCNIISVTSYTIRTRGPRDNTTRWVT